MGNKQALIFAAVTALAGVVLLEVYKRRFEEEVSGGEPVAVLVATVDLPVGATLDKSRIGVRSVPEAYLERRHVRAADLDDVLGATTSLSLRAGDAVLWSDLGAMNLDGRSLSSLVQEGMRAINVAAGAFDGLLRPGDRVDVLFTIQDGDQGEETTVTLLQNVLVLAVGGRTRTEDVDWGASGTVTLSVTVEQSRVVAQAEQRGTLRLVLRHPDDIVVSDADGVVKARDVLEADRRKAWQRRTPSAPRRIEHVR